MAVELTANALQTVPARDNVLFTDTAIACNKGYVVHREGAGIVTLRGIVNNCGNFARYRVTFGGNIAVPTAGGAPVGEISLAIAINGEPLASSVMSVTPAAVGEFFNVSRTELITVPKGCCYTISVENVTGPAGPVDVENASLIIERIA